MQSFNNEPMQKCLTMKPFKGFKDFLLEFRWAVLPLPRDRRNQNSVLQVPDAGEGETPQLLVTPLCLGGRRIAGLRPNESGPQQCDYCHG